MPRRTPGALLPLELRILQTGLMLRAGGQLSFHGFGLAQTLQAHTGSRSLTAHGTLYKALSRLEDAGLLASHWDDAPAEIEGRPRRRLYAVTGLGVQAVELAAITERTAPRPARSPRAIEGSA